MVDDPGPAILVGEFDDVDAAADPRRFATWMDHQRRGTGDPLLTALGIGTGDAALDLGCGTGVDLAAMATRTARAVGVDRSATMAGVAAGRGGAAGTRVAVADGQRLPFAEGSFDAVNCRAVLVHTPRPELTMAEVRRVLRPGGRVLLSEPDHGSHVVATTEVDVFERILRHRRTTFRHPLVGRSLARLAVDAGLTVTDSWAIPIVHRSLAAARAAGGPFGPAIDAAVAADAVSSAEAARYTRSLEEADEAGGFFFAAVSVAVLATAPG